MIIRHLEMHNFGVYAGTNVFEFVHNEPIVLIGGMNGRGKTTFLEAILLSLYGDNSIAYKESKYRSYNKYLRSYVNKTSQSKTTYVELEFTMNESSNNTFLIRREWNALTKITKEHISVWQNGEKSDFLAQNWPMFIENILPSALSSFYFFDGEKIAELAVDNTDEQMKNSIRSMLGITVLDVLKNDLNRILRRNLKKSLYSGSNDELNHLKKEKDTAFNKLKAIDQNLETVNNQILLVQENLKKLQNTYDVKGGSVVEQRQKLMQQKAQLQAEITQNTEKLLHNAASELPLSLVGDLLQQIKLDAEDEYNDFIMKQAINQLDDYIALYKSFGGTSVEESRKFVAFVKEQAESSNEDPVYELTEKSLFQLNDLISYELDSSVNSAKNDLEEKRKLMSQLDEVDSYLSLDINEKELKTIHKQIEELKEKEIELEVVQSHLQQKRISANATVIIKTAEYNRSVEQYLQTLELKDDADRKIKYIDMALKILDKYSIELQKRKTGNLGKTITECYKKLANKKNLIQRIEINPETLEMIYLDDQDKEVSKDSLSAGEKQLMVIAILWALAICSKKKLPVIIDTPLSRLDSQHRTSIVTSYFPNASDQTIILSTDSEIDHHYYEMIKKYIGDEFTLNYNEETKSTTIEKGYFKTI